LPPAASTERSEIMIRVVISDNITRKEEMLPETTTLREAFEMAGVDYASGVSNLDGTFLQPGDTDKNFADFNIKDHCYLTSVVKADNGA
jgi:hypothetical protein